jgi:hypothetical protein
MQTRPPALVGWQTVQLMQTPPPVPQAVLSVPETHDGYGALVEQPPLQAATHAPVATSQKLRLQPSTLLVQAAAPHWWVTLLHACSCGQSAAVRHGTQARETQWGVLIKLWQSLQLPAAPQATSVVPGAQVGNAGAGGAGAVSQQPLAHELTQPLVGSQQPPLQPPMLWAHAVPHPLVGPAPRHAVPGGQSEEPLQTQAPW